MLPSPLIHKLLIPLFPPKRFPHLFIFYAPLQSYSLPVHLLSTSYVLPPINTPLLNSSCCIQHNTIILSILSQRVFKHKYLGEIDAELDNVDGEGKIPVAMQFYLGPERGYHSEVRRFPLVFSVESEKLQNHLGSLDRNLMFLQMAASLLPAPSVDWLQAYRVCEGLGSLDGENLTLKDLGFPTLPDCGEDWFVEDTKDVEEIAQGPAHRRCTSVCVVKAQVAHAKMIKADPSKGLVLTRHNVLFRDICGPKPKRSHRFP